MSHHTGHGVYERLAKRLNRFPQGAPPSPLLFRILSLIIHVKDARLLAQVPIWPFTAERAARRWKMAEAEAASILQRLAERGIILDLEQEGGKVLYVLPPPMAGFFEFSLMRVRHDIDQRTLSLLFHEYINVEDAFIRDLFGRGETMLGRILVHEPALPPLPATAVLEYERASEIIRSASHIAIGLCYCRHKMSHLGRACQAPLDNCMTLNRVAEPLIRHGLARQVEVAEGLDILQEAWSRNLIQCCDNVRQGVNFICHCCRCCCEGLIALRRLAISHPLSTTNFLPVVNGRACTGCGRCAHACPVGAVQAADTTLPRSTINNDLCLGCGICVRTCSQGAISLAYRGERVVTPINTAHRVVLMAIERGTLQHLIFDTEAHLSHRLMAAILGVILRLPGIKQVMASRQMKSRYLEGLLEGVRL